MRVVKYTYTTVAYCDNCGHIEFSLYSFKWPYHTSRKKLCKDCAAYMKNKYKLEVINND